MERLKIAVFAAGKIARNYINMNHEGTIVAVFDNDCKRWGELFCGYEVLAPKDIPMLEFDYLVIATVHESEIRKQLLEIYPKLKEQICSIYKMDCLEYVYRQYRYRYERVEQKTQKYSLKEKKIVIYTGIFGKYDVLQEPLYIDKNVDYICFTDDKNLKSEKWEIRVVECEQKNMALEVRKYKCLPHHFLSDYDVSVWLDARMQIKDSFFDYILENMRDTGMLFFPHSERDCVYEEGAACIAQHKGSINKIINQLYKYCSEGYPEHNGLYCGGCIVREHNKIDIIKVMEDWYEEILCTSARDQISLPYILNKNSFTPDLCNKYIWDNNLMTIHNHVKYEE